MSDIPGPDYRELRCQIVEYLESHWSAFRLAL